MSARGRGLGAVGLLFFLAWVVAGSIAVNPALSAAPSDQRNRSGRDHSDDRPSGKQLFERETFGGNGRTCRTCHSRETGTVSPEDAQHRQSSSSPCRRSPEGAAFKASWCRS